MFRRFTKKRTLVALTAVAALVVAGAAYAYLTASGTGSGSGDVSATTSAMTLKVSNAPALTRLGDTETYEISAHNPGSSPEKVSSITATASPSADATGCPAGSFSADNATTTGTEVPANGDAVVGHVDVHFNDDAAHAQNGCIGTGTVALSLSSN